MPLAEDYSNYVMLDRLDGVDALRDAFYRNTDNWQQRSSESFFANCGWYKFPYCSLVPWYQELNTADIIGVGPSDIYRCAKSFITEAADAVGEITKEQMFMWGAELNLVYPNDLVKRHFDRHFYSDYTTRCHLVIETNPKVKFIFANSQKTFETGDLFLFNNKLEHSIYNGGSIGRLHLVIDFVPASVFRYVERSIAPFGGHDGTRHILANLKPDHPRYSEFITTVKGHRELVPRKSVEFLNATRMDRLA